MWADGTVICIRITEADTKIGIDSAVLSNMDLEIVIILFFVICFHFILKLLRIDQFQVFAVHRTVIPHIRSIRIIGRCKDIFFHGSQGIILVNIKGIDKIHFFNRIMNHSIAKIQIRLTSGDRLLDFCNIWHLLFVIFIRILHSRHRVDRILCLCIMSICQMVCNRKRSVPESMLKIIHLIQLDIPICNQLVPGIHRIIPLVDVKIQFFIKVQIHFPVASTEIHFLRHNLTGSLIKFFLNRRFNFFYSSIVFFHDPFPDFLFLCGKGIQMVQSFWNRVASGFRLNKILCFLICFKPLSGRTFLKLFDSSCVCGFFQRIHFFPYFFSKPVRGIG